MRRLQIKFPSQIRISGWDFGSSARAMNQAGGKDSLMTYESVPTQADLVKVTKSTTERKTMSTKTSIKRIALIAVSALGFGMMTAVAPASAAEATVATEVTAVTIATSTTGRVNNSVTSSLSITTASTVEAGDNISLRARFDSKPAASTTAKVAFNNTGLALKLADETDVTGETGTFTAADAAGNELLPAKYVVVDANEALGDQAHVVGRIGFVPDVVGTYVVRVWHDADGDGLVGATEVTDTETFTVAAAPTTVTVTNISGASPAADGYGTLFKVALTNASGATGLASNETLTLDPDAAAEVKYVNGIDVGTGLGAAYTLSASDFTGGIAWIGVRGTVGTSTITFAGAGGDVASLTGSFTSTFKTVDDSWTGTWSTGTSGTDGFHVYGATIGSATEDDGTGNDITVPLGSSTMTWTLTSTAGLAAAAYTSATVTDSDGRVTGSYVQGITGLKYDVAVTNSGTADAGTGSFSVTLNAVAVDNSYTVVTAGGTAWDGEIVADTIDMDGGSVTATPSTISAATGTTLNFNVASLDQFGRALVNGTVTMSVSGRNVTTASTQVTKVTDGSGYASFSLTDAPAAGVTATTDTVTFTALDQNGQNLDGTASITWGAVTVGTVTILGGNNTTTGVAASTTQYKDINAGNGAQLTTAPITATIKDASGNVLSGVPVTFTVSGTGAAILSTKATVYTAADGTAASSVYAWLAGSYTVTATAGGKTGTSVYAFRQSGAGEERKISATVSGAVVTAKVVDRYGNPVPSVTVYATKSGEGYFGTGTLRTSTTTDNLGEAQFVVTGGSATVTVSTLAWDAVEGTNPSGQTCAAAGKINCVVGTTAATAITAYVAGTSTTAEVGVGSSYADAGVSSASVEVTVSANTDSVDAANEATDAANAATDAANAAAEAADAATAAAQDAHAAVAALATQVASLIAGIKAQITTLTNLVIKIQKKVRA